MKCYILWGLNTAGDADQNVCNFNYFKYFGNREIGKFEHIWRKISHLIGSRSVGHYGQILAKIKNFGFQAH